jgi:hypothetical protein
MPAGLLGHTPDPLLKSYESGTRSPFATDLFLKSPFLEGGSFDLRSTGSKQTLNGLFYVICQSSFFFSFQNRLRDDPCFLFYKNWFVRLSTILSCFDLNFYPTRQIELAQCIYCTAGRGVDIQQALVGSQLELFTALLIHVW